MPIPTFCPHCAKRYNLDDRLMSVLVERDRPNTARKRGWFRR